MEVIWLAFFGSAVILPATAILALRWAIRHGEFQHNEKNALMIFNEEEPVDEMTDFFPGHGPAGQRAGGLEAKQRQEQTAHTSSESSANQPRI